MSAPVVTMHNIVSVDISRQEYQRSNPATEHFDTIDILATDAKGQTLTFTLFVKPGEKFKGLDV